MVHGKQRIFDGFFKIDEAELSYERFDGSMTPVVKRLCFERGDSVAAIVKHRDSGNFLFLRQFRYPTHDKGPGWMVEVVAGMQEHGEEAELSLRRELLEEIGYQADLVEPIATFYVFLLFYAEVSDRGKTGAGGGLLDECEDIQTISYSPAELEAALAHGEIQDAKTLVGIFWLRSREARANSRQ